MTDKDAWITQLHTILGEVADAQRAIASAQNTNGIHGVINAGAANKAVAKLVPVVRAANEIGQRIGETPLLVPGEKPAPGTDLRPWWSRLLDVVSGTARRQTADSHLETLRMEADAALVRATRTS